MCRICCAARRHGRSERSYIHAEISAERALCACGRAEKCWRLFMLSSLKKKRARRPTNKLIGGEEFAAGWWHHHREMISCRMTAAYAVEALKRDG